MTIVVKHRKTGNEYILLAVNAMNGGGKINLPSRFLNDLFPQSDAENYGLVTVCDVRGNIFLSYIDDLIVSEIDGKKPSEVLPEIVVPSISEEVREVSSNDEDSADEDSTSVASETSTYSTVDDDFAEDDDWI